MLYLLISSAEEPEELDIIDTLVSDLWELLSEDAMTLERFLIYRRPREDIPKVNVILARICCDDILENLMAEILELESPVHWERWLRSKSHEGLNLQKWKAEAANYDSNCLYSTYPEPIPRLAVWLSPGTWKEKID